MQQAEGSQPALSMLPPKMRGPVLPLQPADRMLQHCRRLPPLLLLLLVLLPQPSLATSLQSMTSYSSYDLQQQASVLAVSG
jgi:hypothetical protein